MYEDILTSLKIYVDSLYKEKANGFVYYGLLNVLFFRTMSSKTFLMDLLSDMMLYRNLTQIKINKSAEACYSIIENYNIPITEYQLFLAITVAVGAEAELLFSIKEGKIKMTYDKLATTINKLLFTMLKINENEIKSINNKSKDIAENINTDTVYDYIKEKNSWLQD